MTRAQRDLAVLRYIAEHPGSTSIPIGQHFKFETSLTYGYQRLTSESIARLRQRGYVVDCVRCPQCGRALTRGKRNVQLIVTPAGVAKLLTLF
jgi:hypothetical protein